MEYDWIHQVNKHLHAGTPVVVATIWSIHGTSPETAGTRLVVTGSSCHGQFHSRERQQQSIAQCHLMLRRKQTGWQELTFQLGDVAGAPNGTCTIVFEVFSSTGKSPEWLKLVRKSLRDGVPVQLACNLCTKDKNIQPSYRVIRQTEGIPDQSRMMTEVIHENDKSKTLLQLITEPVLAVAVVGHSKVTVSLVKQLLLLPFKITWITKDNHHELQAPQLTYVTLTDDAIISLSAGTLMVIASNNHELDIQCCYWSLQNSGLSYIGCLGSKKKADRVKSKLKEMGINKSRLALLKVPIGLETISGKQPSIIAASIVAQLLATR